MVNYSKIYLNFNRFCTLVLKQIIRTAGATKYISTFNYYILGD